MQMPALLPILPLLPPTPEVQPKRLAERIREAYPNPVCYEGQVWSRKNYCVLIAAHFFGGSSTAEGYSGALEALNPKLEHKNAMKRGCDIAVANDSGNFERAWQLLDEALEAK